MRRLGVALVATLVVALAAGCGGSNPKPSPVSEPSASATASASASPSGAPTMPAAAQGTTPASAEAFVRYYVDVFNYATRTGDVTRFKSLATSDCASCERLLSTIQSFYDAGGLTTGDLYSVIRLKATDSVVQARLRQLPQVTVASIGASPTTAKTGTLGSRFTLRSNGASWRMQDWSVT